MRRRAGQGKRLSIRATARVIGVTEGAIRKAIRAGRCTPPGEDGLLDVAQVRREVRATTDPRFQRNGHGDAEAVGMRKRLLAAQTRRLELAIAKESGVLSGPTWSEVYGLIDLARGSVRHAVEQWSGLFLYPALHGTEPLDVNPYEALCASLKLKLEHELGSIVERMRKLQTAAAARAKEEQDAKALAGIGRRVS